MIFCLSGITITTMITDAGIIIRTMVRNHQESRLIARFIYRLDNMIHVIVCKQYRIIVCIYYSFMISPRRIIKNRIRSVDILFLFKIPIRTMIAKELNDKERFRIDIR